MNIVWYPFVPFKFKWVKVVGSVTMTVIVRLIVWLFGGGSGDLPALPRESLKYKNQSANM